MAKPKRRRQRHWRRLRQSCEHCVTNALGGGSAGHVLAGGLSAEELFEVYGSPGKLTLEQGNRFPFRELVAVIGDASSFSSCETALAEVGLALGLPRVGLVPDIARPYFNADVDAFFRRQQWPDGLLQMWWNKRGPIKMGLYVRCRFAALPFIASVSEARPRTKGASVEEREMARLFVRHGLPVLLAVPIHLPRSQIALLVFAGDADPAVVGETLRSAAPDLIAAGQLAMHSWNAERLKVGPAREEMSRLTQREWDCLRLMAQGFRDTEIATLSGISITTVRYHIENLVRKLGAVNRMHAVALSCQLGLVGPLGP